MTQLRDYLLTCRLTSILPASFLFTPTKSAYSISNALPKASNTFELDIGFLSDQLPEAQASPMHHADQSLQEKQALTPLSAQLPEQHVSVPVSMLSLAV